MRTDEEMRTMRLARGLRAVAATVIVGGIVIAALRHGSDGGARDVARCHRRPGRSPLASAQAHRVGPASREIEPALERIERSMEHHG